jgi:acyl dehydratase
VDVVHRGPLASLDGVPIDASAVGTGAGPWSGEIDARWLMSYAAGIDRTDDVYLDTLRDGGVVGHPMFPVAPEWQLITDRTMRVRMGTMTPDEGLRGVHAGHDIVLHRPITSCERVSITSEVIGVQATKPGALVTTRFEAHDRDTHLWTTTMRSMYRGVAVDGESAPPNESDPPPVTSGSPDEERVVALGPHAAHVYTECARIWNPIHTDPTVAKAAGLPGIILHGTATLAHGVSFAMDVLGAQPQDVHRLGGSFRAMVRLPSEITVRVTAGEAAAAFQVLNADGEPAVRDGYVVLR